MPVETGLFFTGQGISTNFISESISQQSHRGSLSLLATGAKWLASTIAVTSKNTNSTLDMTDLHPRIISGRGGYCMVTALVLFLVPSINAISKLSYEAPELEDPSRSFMTIPRSA